MQETFKVHSVSARAVDNSALRLIKACRQGRIHSVFHRCCNISVDKFGLLTLADESFPRMPGLVHVNDIDFKTFTVGTDVLFENSRLFFPENDLLIDCAHADQYTCQRQKFNVSLRVVPEYLSEAWNTVCKYGCHVGLVEIKQAVRAYDFSFDGNAGIGRLGLSALGVLCNGIILENTEEIRHGVNGLLGLGPGLTPSGDDIIGGMTAAFYLCGPENLSGILADIVEDALSRGGRTTQVSECSLCHTLRGEISDAVYSATKSICTYNKFQVVNSFKKVIEYGSTSGTEIAMGICLGLELMLKTEKNITGEI